MKHLNCWFIVIYFIAYKLDAERKSSFALCFPVWDCECITHTQSIDPSSFYEGGVPKLSTLMMEQCCLHFSKSNLNSRVEDILKYSGDTWIEFDEIVGHEIILLEKKKKKKQV